MERYRFILKDERGSGVDHICEILPENTKGLMLKKEFLLSSMPIGYSVSASAEKIRLIREDANILIDYFFVSGISAFMKCEMQTLNRLATGYETSFVGRIDFESIEVTDIYAGFGISLDESTAYEWKNKAKVDISITSED
jgi:hypothetical protein